MERCYLQELPQAADEEEGEEEMKNLAYGITMVVGFTLVIGIATVTWYFGRRINYSFAYKVLVKETIREMVKPEYLKP